MHEPLCAGDVYVEGNEYEPGAASKTMVYMQ